MKLIWHIIWKDIRSERWALLMWMALFAAHLAVGNAFLRMDGTDLEWIDQLRIGGLLLTITEYALGYLLALRWVQADELSGTRMFWATRPISGGRLLAAKGLGLFLVFGLLPVTLWLPWWIEAGISTREIGWLAVEVLGWQLPVIATALLIGSLTDDFGRTIMWSLLLVLAVIAWSIVGQSNLTAPGYTQFVRGFTGLWFSRLFVAGVLLALGFTAISAGQFRARNSVRSLVRIGVLGLLIIGVGQFWVWDFSEAFDRPGGSPESEPMTGLAERIVLSVQKAQFSKYHYRTVTANGPETVHPLLITFDITGLPEDLVLSGEHPLQELRWSDGSVIRSGERNHSFPTQAELMLRRRLSLSAPPGDPETVRWGQARLKETNAKLAAKGLPPLEDYWAQQLQPAATPALAIRFPVPESALARIRTEPPAYATLMEGQVARWDVVQSVPLIPGAWGPGRLGNLHVVSMDNWVTKLVETVPTYRRLGLFQSRAGQRRPNPDRPAIFFVNRVTGDLGQVFGRNLVPTTITVGGVEIKWSEATLSPVRWVRDGRSVIKDPEWVDHTRLVVMVATEVGRFRREIRSDRLALQFPPDQPPAPVPSAGSSATSKN